MLTYIGRTIDLDQPPIDLMESINFLDIAHSLAHTCRFNGHTPWHYSVAQHSIYCSDVAANKYREHPTEVRDTMALHALLHDAHEAYTQDIIRPNQKYIPVEKLKALQFKVTLAIYLKLGVKNVTIPQAKIIKEIDDRMLATELHAFWKAPSAYTPYQLEIKRASHPIRIRDKFMCLLSEYSKVRFY